LLQAFANGPNSSLVAATNGELTSEGLWKVTVESSEILAIFEQIKKYEW
jgi:hypothetical protein